MASSPAGVAPVNMGTWPIGAKDGSEPIAEVGVGHNSAGWAVEEGLPPISRANGSPIAYLQQGVTLCRRRFAEGNLLVLPFKLLRADQADFLHKILRFLGVAPIETGPLARISNPSWSPSMIGLIRLGNGLGLPWRRTVKWVGRLRRMPGFRRGRGSGGITRQRLSRAAGKFSELLRDENYGIWNGDLARFNYTFGH